MRRMRLLSSAVFLAAAMAVPASAVGDATYTLASYRAMATPTDGPADRIMAVYRASAERFAMLERIREKYPAFHW